MVNVQAAVPLEGGDSFTEIINGIEVGLALLNRTEDCVSSVEDPVAKTTLRGCLESPFSRIFAYFFVILRQRETPIPCSV